MLGRYGRIFECTFTGSMMGVGPERHAVWAYVCANARRGEVELNTKLLAACLGMSEEATAAAIEFHCQPDPKSRNQEHEGRRLIHKGGFSYTVTGWQRYRSEPSTDERREYMRDAKRKERLRKQEAGHDDPIIAAEIPTEKEVIDYGATVGCTQEICAKFHAHYCEQRKWLNAYQQLVDWKRILVRWRENEKAPRAFGPTSQMKAAAAATAGNTVANRIAIEKTIKILEGQIMESPANPESTFFNSDRTDLDKAALRELRRKKAALEQQLANLVTQGV